MSSIWVFSVLLTALLRHFCSRWCLSVWSSDHCPSFVVVCDKLLQSWTLQGRQNHFLYFFSCGTGCRGAGCRGGKLLVTLAIDVDDVLSIFSTSSEDMIFLDLLFSLLALWTVLRLYSETLISHRCLFSLLSFILVVAWRSFQWADWFVVPHREPTLSKIYSPLVLFSEICSLLPCCTLYVKIYIFS